jgi:hypothetical protein
MLNINSFKFELEFKKARLNYLTRSLKFMTGIKLKILIDEANEIEQVWKKIFIHYCLLPWNQVTAILTFSTFANAKPKISKF